MIKLLIVEDEPLERVALRKIIQRDFNNIEIIEDAKNGIEAIEKAKAHRPDVILMDIRMPETTGIEAQKKIIQFLPTVKTIIVTAYGDFSYAQEAIKYGVTDYLLKPAKPADIKKAIEKAISLNIKVVPTSTTPIFDSNSTQQLLMEAIGYIEKNYKSEIRLTEVAKMVHLNPQYFSRLFKKELGTTFTEYVTKIRIDKAKALLTETNLPIYRIAVELGFSDAAYFSKVFLKYEKESPHEYKKHHEHNGTNLSIHH
ncbi:response regulator transcription factor [Neobacillus niacini]|uniref:response regulator transcription factor n=1 Tax=Neobacillus niacini TaxID=86668 RepID=UPI002041DB50|nr:response regulator [Neobacillus niacini]MCM3691895.1 response regulator [Neobacillus niacini]